VHDILGYLQESVIKTASFNSLGYDLNSGTPSYGLSARVLYSAAANASGSNTVVFSIEHSDDNATFYALSSGAADVITLNTTAQSGEIFIPFKTKKRYVRLVATVAGAGSTPTVTYESQIGLN